MPGFKLAWMLGSTYYGTDFSILKPPYPAHDRIDEKIRDSSSKDFFLYRTIQIPVAH